jgi:hypothetical protein
MFRIDIKKLFVIVGVVFYCTAVYAVGEEVKDIQVQIDKSGGRLILAGTDKGETGYASASKEEWKDGYGTTYIRIQCSGRGRNTCNFNTSLPPIIYDKVIAKVQSDIDWGRTAGSFLIGDFVCIWSDGEKEADEDDADVFTYSYKLEITNVTSVIIENLEIQIFPNPVLNSATVRFSMPINAMMNVKIVDAMGDVYWNVNRDVVGETLVLPAAVISALQSGMYYVVCTNNDYTAHASFFKQ